MEDRGGAGADRRRVRHSVFRAQCDDGAVGALLSRRLRRVLARRHIERVGRHGDRDALVPVFFMGRTPPDLTAPANLISIFIFVTMGIAISVVHERLRTIMAQLERSRKWLQAIMDNSPNVIVIKEMTGRYLMANRQFEEMLQLDPERPPTRRTKHSFPRRARIVIAGPTRRRS